MYRAALEAFLLTPQLRNDLKLLLQNCQDQVHSSSYASPGSVTSPPALTMTDTPTQMSQFSLFSTTPQIHSRASDTPTRTTHLSLYSATARACHQAWDQANDQAGELEPPAPSALPAPRTKPVDRETYEQVGTLVRLQDESHGFQQEGSLVVEPVDSFFGAAIGPDWISDNTGMSRMINEAIVPEMPENTDWSFDNLHMDFQDLEWNDFNMDTLLAEPVVQENIPTKNPQAEDPPL
jgi:hypothetical protein